MEFSDDDHFPDVDNSVHSARAAHWIANLVVPSRLRENVWGDLNEDYAVRFPGVMPRGHASRWLLRQLFSAAPRFVLLRLRTEISILHWFTLLASTLLGISLAYVESRPTWDDTGVLVFAILITTATLGFIGVTRPWFTAFVVGSWIPLHDIVAHGGYASFAAILFAFVGAYGGAAIRHIFVISLCSR
jgi:hypothetical protein